VTYVVRSRAAWKARADAARARLEAAGAGADAPMAALAAIDFEAFHLLIEAFAALGMDVSPDILRLAGVRRAR
jgi:hypothetical protein